MIGRVTSRVAIGERELFGDAFGPAGSVQPSVAHSRSIVSRHASPIAAPTSA